MIFIVLFLVRRFGFCSTALRRNYTQIEFCLLSRDQCVVDLATVPDGSGDEYQLSIQELLLAEPIFLYRTKSFTLR